MAAWFPLLQNPDATCTTPKMTRTSHRLWELIWFVILLVVFLLWTYVPA
jgi:hypothetical protein